jgi:uncharacterized membrane protein YidH (DUF202 family)
VLLMYFLNDFEMVPVAPINTGITLAFTFHMRCISIVRSSYFKIFSDSFFNHISVSWNCFIIIIIIIIIIISVYVRCFRNSGAVIELEIYIPKAPVWFRTKVENILKETFIFLFLLFDYLICGRGKLPSNS